MLFQCGHRQAGKNGQAAGVQGGEQDRVHDSWCFAHRGFVLGRIEIEPLHAIAQGVAADLQFVGGLGEIVGIGFQRRIDEVAFKVRDDLINRRSLVATLGAAVAGALLSRVSSWKSGRLSALHFAGGFEDEGALNDIAQVRARCRASDGIAILLRRAKCVSRPCSLRR